MIQKLTGVLAALVLALIISVVLLFVRNAELQRQIDAVKDAADRAISETNGRVAMLEDAAKIATDSLDTLGESLRSQRRSLKALKNAAESTADDLGDYKKRLHRQRAELERVANLTQSNEKALAIWKQEIIAKTKSGIAEEIVVEAAVQVVNEMVNDASLLSSQEFIDSIAQSLADRHRQQLRGEPGIDADNESIAKLLLADPDFLNRISVSTLLNDKSR